MLFIFWFNFLCCRLSACYLLVLHFIVLCLNIAISQIYIFYLSDWVSSLTPIASILLVSSYSLCLWCLIYDFFSCIIVAPGPELSLPLFFFPFNYSLSSLTYLLFFLLCLTMCIFSNDTPPTWIYPFPIVHSLPILSVA